ncbi:MAG: alpha-amylase/alpha-mannosidase [Planctomycetes bacterium]|nr:alpha-amylase/alpha-mannosidase [Planctomycetota bacterium]
MGKVHLAFLWHQHQPCYRDLLTGDVAMPWVRLHGTKDYFGMAALAEEFPALRLNFNLVPCLLRQLEDYLSGAAIDTHQRRSLLPATDLTEEDRAWMLTHLFMVHPRVIQSYPRYAQIWEKAGLRGRGPGRATREFSVHEFLDLQVLANLAWFHPLVFERDAELAALRDRGRDFTEHDKALVFDRQKQVLRQVIPLHRRLQDEGRIEVTTTPFYHPILPLLLDVAAARVAMPDCRLPQVELATAEDAEVQVRRAVELYRRQFGRDPRGMWPAEGSVSPAILPLLEKYGIRWIATDEEILAHSVGRWPARDARGNLENPDLLYRPYRLPGRERDLGIVFRDLRLSDLLGFQYQHEEPRRAAEDFLRRLGEVKARARHSPVLVSVILDGENAWEHYPKNGIEFLRALYQGVTADPDLETVRIGDFLEQNPPTESIATLYTGSWIAHNFYIWIGHEEDRRAWEYVGRVRSDLVAAARAGTLPPEKLDLAWECFYAAEGSDWFWWFGDDHSSALDLEFDALFRTHLMNVYRALAREVPPFLFEPIKRRHKAALFTAPQSLLKVRVDGRRSDYFEWIGAGEYDTAKDVSSMDRAVRPLLTHIRFGFDAENAFFLLETAGRARQVLGDDWRALVTFGAPREVAIEVTARPDRPAPTVRAVGPGGVARACGAAACDEAVEIACPFSELGFSPHQTAEFYVELALRGEPAGRFPAGGPLLFEVPSPNFETVHWQA